MTPDPRFTDRTMTVICALLVLALVALILTVVWFSPATRHPAPLPSGLSIGAVR